MSDSQILFSAAISNVIPEEKPWLEAWLKDKAEQRGGVGFEWSFEQAADDSTYLYVHTDTVFGGDIEQLAEFAQAFLAEWRPDGTFRVEYAIVETDFDSFSGGVVIITATKQRWFNTHQMLMLDQTEALIRHALEHAETMATPFDGAANPYLEVGNSILAEELLIPLNEALKTLGLSPSELWRQAEQAQMGEE
jgi:hypothetical protein